MDEIVWCMRKKNGIGTIEPNANLTQAYIGKAEASLETMRLAKSRDWKISAAYYSLYFALYAVLMRIGVKCEIHSCTLAFAERFLAAHFTNADLALLQDALQARVDAQYYVDREIKDATVDQMLREAPRFLAHCKEVALKLDEKEIGTIRKTISQYR